MRKLLLAVILVGCAGFLNGAAEPNDCSAEVLPDGPKECRFRHIEAALGYSDGELTVRWPNFYVVEDALLAKNWKRMFPYQPGSTVRVEFAPGHRYDLVARFTDQRTGETFLGVTLISDVKRGADRGRRAQTSPSMSGRAKGLAQRSCTISTDVDCTDSQGNPAGTVAVECTGDTGTCSDSCSDSETACCSSTSTTTERSGNGTVISSSTIQERQQSCE